MTLARRGASCPWSRGRSDRIEADWDPASYVIITMGQGSDSGKSSGGNRDTSADAFPNSRKGAKAVFSNRSVPTTSTDRGRSPSGLALFRGVPFSATAARPLTRPSSLRFARDRSPLRGKSAICNAVNRFARDSEGVSPAGREDVSRWSRLSGAAVVASPVVPIEKVFPPEPIRLSLRLCLCETPGVEPGAAPTGRCGLGFLCVKPRHGLTNFEE